MSRQNLVPFILAALALTPAAAQDWKPVPGHMMSRWAAEVSPAKAWPEYPRPQMVRPDWLNLNGLWDYAITQRGAATPAAYAGKILVPFPIESALSGVKKTVSPDQRLWYRHSFEIPPAWKGRRVLLHFGAVDWHAVVEVNGIPVGEHKGGYTPFAFDITHALKAGGPQSLSVAVWDPTDAGTQPRGKQVIEPQGIWYTAVTGIWQTVWLEPVPETSIRALRVTPDVDARAAKVEVSLSRPSAGRQVKVTVRDGNAVAGTASGGAGGTLTVPIASPKLWSPDSPHLYDFEVSLLDNGKQVDRVTGYLGMRKISLGKDANGHTRLMLNGEPLFQLGPLDQGWWPDGLYTAPNDAALRYDVEMTRKLGFNMARKHVKVEPARWYYHCDKLGLLVWQDMPSAFPTTPGVNNLRVAAGEAKDPVREGVSASQFEAELAEMIAAFHNFPSIIVWVPFNEGWGQYDVARVTDWLRHLDPGRLLNSTSGWEDRGVGDMMDIHMYPGPGMERAEEKRAIVLGEYGGLGWPVEGHLWWNKRNWGYQTYQDRASLNKDYHEFTGSLHGMIGRGLSAGVYTQTTDVEGEVNGLMTYDRQMVKFDPAALTALHAKLYGKAPRATVFLPASEHQPQSWQYTYQAPVGEWRMPGHNASGWQQGNAPLQTGKDPLFPTGTVWPSGDAWMRRSFQLKQAPKLLWLEIYHDVDRGGVYLNGTQVYDFAATRPARRHYRMIDISRFASALRAGENVIAIHGASDKPQRGLDAGLFAVEP